MKRWHPQKRQRQRQRQRQRGMVLLSVSLLLAMLAALAYSMNRDGAMAMQTVEAQYDLAKARYLAEAGLNLARWQDEQGGCSNPANLAATSLPGIGSFSATVSGPGKTINVKATGVTLNGASYSLSRSNLAVHNLSKPSTASLKISSDTYLRSDLPTQVSNTLDYYELTQNATVALLQTDMGGVPARSTILTAELKLFQYQAAASPAGQVVSVHRVARDWDNNASWQMAKGTTPWTTPGGDYAAANVAAATLAGNGLTTTWDIAAMVDGWSNGLFVNNGLLLRPDGPLQQVRLASQENVSYPKPTVNVTFYPPC